MVSIEATIEGKFLSLCPSNQAVDWLKEKRAGMGKRLWLSGPDHEHQETILAQRNDPFIDFGLARYGTKGEAVRPVYARADKL